MRNNSHVLLVIYIGSGNQSINQSISQSVSHSVTHSLNQSINQSINSFHDKYFQLTQPQLELHELVLHKHYNKYNSSLHSSIVSSYLPMRRI